jgi:hypothetical protein
MEKTAWSLAAGFYAAVAASSERKAPS